MDFRKFRKFLGTEYFQLYDWRKAFIRRKRNLQHGFFSVVQLISIPSMGLYNISAPLLVNILLMTPLKNSMFTIKTSLSLFFSRFGAIFLYRSWLSLPLDFMQNLENYY